MERSDKIALRIILALIVYNVIVVASFYLNPTYIRENPPLIDILKLTASEISGYIPMLVPIGWLYMLFWFPYRFVVAPYIEWGSPLRTIFCSCWCILGWLSVFMIVKYSKGMSLIKRVIYIFIIPPLIVALLAFMFCFPLH